MAADTPEDPRGRPPAHEPPAPTDATIPAPHTDASSPLVADTTSLPPLIDDATSPQLVDDATFLAPLTSPTTPSQATVAPTDAVTSTNLASQPSDAATSAARTVATPSDPASQPAVASTTSLEIADAPPVPRSHPPSVVVHRRGSSHLPAAKSLPLTPDDPDGDSAQHDRPSQPPWARILLALAICGPALWIGGVPAVVVPAFLGVVLLLWLRLCTRSPERLRVPYGAAIGGFAVLITLLQWVPLPAAIRAALAPDLAARTSAALADSGVDAWPGLSPVPGDSALEVARLLGLTALFIAAAQLSWRVSAALVAGLGSVVALLGLLHAGLGVRKIYGFYQPSDVDPTQTVALLTSFVNANHQSGLFTLGIFCAAALAVYHRMVGQQTSEPGQATRARERSLVALAAVALQGVALVLSLSRGAMSALVLVAPIALWFAWRGEPKDRPRQWLQRIAMVVGFALVGVFVARYSGAWAELATLSREAEAGATTKFRVAEEAVDLVVLSPILGVGRGAFIDLYPAIDSMPNGVRHTHLESTPVTMIVEWGPGLGGLIGLGLLWWWIAAIYSSGGRHGRPRRIALCGPLALAIHSVGDFSLEFLGVAAPLCALAGSLSERRQIVRWPARRAARLGAVTLVAGLALAVWAVPHTWQRRPRGDLSERTALSKPADLRTRPLDSDLHTALAFQAAEAADWDQARARALVATTLRPDAADPWWLLTNAEHALGNPDASAVALARMLAVVRKPLPVPVAQALRQRYPNAEELATHMPAALAPWTLVMESLIPLDPAYAAILAAARNQVDGHEPEVLRLQVRIALEMQNPGLARYHTTLLRQLAPHQVTSHLLHVQALQGFRVPREREIQSVLEETLRAGLVPDLAESSLLEDALIESYLRENTPESRARARDLLPALLTRPGDRGVLQRRNGFKQLLAEQP